MAVPSRVRVRWLLMCVFVVASVGCARRELDSRFRKAITITQRYTPSREGRFWYFPNLGGHGISMRDVRVYLPPSYDQSVERFPVLIMLDGHLAWEGGFDVGTTLDELTSEGVVPPHVVVAIPASSIRAYELTPWNPSHCPRNDDACSERMHNVTVYAMRDYVFQDVLPRIAELVRIERGREHTTLFGFSFGGLAAVYMMMHASSEIGRFVISSPSVWWQHMVVVDDLLLYRGPMPERVSVDVGANESPDAVASAVMVREVASLSRAFRERGLVEGESIRQQVYEDSAHTARAAGVRLRDSLRFVLARDERETRRSSL